ncbi:MAG: HNH endonuclease signature motif containing protein [Polyangiales bacterium]
MSVPDRLARAVLARDGFRCVYCRASIAVGLSIDHVTPQAWFRDGEAVGDPDVRTNLAAACLDCNSIKRDMDLETFCVYLSRRWPSRWTEARIAAMVSRVRASLSRPTGAPENTP